MAKGDSSNNEGTVVEDLGNPETRGSARDKIFGSPTELKKELYTLNGVQIELRQPTVNGFMEEQGSDDGRQTVIKIIISNSYIPGTNEKVFESGDYDSLMAMPFSKEWADLTEVINKVINIEVEAKVKN